VIYQAQEKVRGLHIPAKTYSFHEPHLACIRKGKLAKTSEYGTKFPVTVNRRSYAVDHKEYASIPKDSHAARIIPPWFRRYTISRKKQTKILSNPQSDCDARSPGMNESAYSGAA
jgi:hypothetical protein